MTLESLATATSLYGQDPAGRWQIPTGQCSSEEPSLLQPEGVCTDGYHLVLRGRGGCVSLCGTFELVETDPYEQSWVYRRGISFLQHG